MRTRRALTVVVSCVAILLPIAVAPAGAVGDPPHGTPIWGRSFPDPELLRVGSTWYAFATDGPLGNVQLLSSPDLERWTARGDALGSAPAWAQGDDVWAPAVFAVPAGGFVLYASFVHRSTGRRCIGAATADTVTGPYAGVSTPVACSDDQGGAIDPAVSTIGGTSYLVWKSEGIVDRTPPTIWSAPLAADGLTVTGLPSVLLRSTQPWEGSLIENPSLVQDGGRTYLFFSGNEWERSSYATGWGVCAGPSGPCATPPNRPLLTTEGAGLQGPGGASAFRDETGQWWLAFAAWTATPGTTHRATFLRRLRFVAGRPVLQAADGSYPVPALARRVAGADRYATAAAFSGDTVQAPRPVTYVATGESFADALSAASASGWEDSPVLLVRPDAVPDAVDAELRRITPGHIVVMGGAAAVSTAVEDRLRSYAAGLHREAGADRYDTAARVARNTFRTPGVPVAYVAAGDPFADGVAAGAAGAANGGPLVLVRRDDLPGATADALRAVQPRRIVLLGGTSSVSAGVEAQLGAIAPVTRIAGATRYETAALLAEQELGGMVGGVVVATGERFPDAVVAGAAGYPVLLVPSNGPAPAVVRTALERLAPLGVVVVGGAGAVSDATLRSLGL